MVKEATTPEPPAEAGTITAEQAARLIMVTPQWVRQLVKADYIKPVGRGRYNLVSVVQGYIRFLKDEERRTSKSAADSRVRDARAAEIEMRNAARLRELIPIEEALAEYDALVAAVREAFDSIPARVTRDIELRRKIEAEVHGAKAKIAEALLGATEAARTGIPSDRVAAD